MRDIKDIIMYVRLSILTKNSEDASSGRPEGCAAKET